MKKVHIGIENKKKRTIQIIVVHLKNEFRCFLNAINLCEKFNVRRFSETTLKIVLFSRLVYFLNVLSAISFILIGPKVIRACAIDH